MSTDPHRPTPAGPDPATGSVAASSPEGQAAAATGPEPTPTVGASDASFTRPPGSAAPAGSTGTGGPGGLDLEALANDRPEVLAGAAFAGGLIAAMILKRLGH